MKENLGYPEAHPSFDQIFEAYNEKVESIDEGALKNQIKKFVILGALYYVNVNNEKRYGVHEGNHCHFICEKCGKVKDVFLEEGAINMLTEYSQRRIRSASKIDKVNISFEGECFDCK